MKNQRILMQYMSQYETHQCHLFNVAKLPCESRNSENIILQWDITKENCIKCIIYASSKWTCRLSNLQFVQQHMYKTKICDIYDLQKCFMETWADFEQNVIEAVIDQWHDHLTSCVRAADRHFEHLLWNYCSFVLCGLSEHFMKLLM